MDKQQICELVKYNVLRAGMRNLKTIKHPKNPNVEYLPQKMVLMHDSTGEWIPAVQYTDRAGQTFVRPADQFGKFEEVNS